MSNDLILEFNSPSTVTIAQNCSFEDFVAQFQTSCSKILCIVNDKQLHYYDKKAELPIGLKFEYKRKFKERTTYYFCDVANNTYCVFGREVAQQFYPRLEEVDPTLQSLVTMPSPRSKRDYKVSKLDRIESLHRSTTINKAIVAPVIISKHKVNVATTHIVKSKCPSEVVIVDCGQRYTFPHANYNIEVHNHNVY